MVLTTGIVAMVLTTGMITAAGAGLGFIIQYCPPFRWAMGPRARWLERVRREVSTLLGRVFDERAGPRPITEGEYAGTLHRSLAETERLLWRYGFRRNPMSRLKTRDGTPEVGSWVYRTSPLADRQLHVMLFPGSRGGVDIYAHTEPSSVHPLVGNDHFTGQRQNVAAGVSETRDRLPLTIDRPIPDPPAGPWTSAQ